ncbi:hypothetical protein Osc7112_3572 [Oscillatoria nigro-viridis PCC 7112]|uniref:DUF6745 domain-containing protein n=1 Tax=Phormidium nigroviride PCC 7112 TaxID=179408 RepID=K9VIZ6_9CYAN|nr:hypothetical protein [Oscillatoria nigro-viridis]AFZ07936.1 hypothetical protein Osc7112_3572 [Oscillatoria nigro-viridis PCC 7112]
MTPEQTALIPIYREQWRQIGLSIAPIDRPQATAAINTAYNIIRCSEPKIIFCDHEFQRWYPPRDRSVESIPNRKSKILKKEHLSRASQSQISNLKSIDSPDAALQAFKPLIEGDFGSELGREIIKKIHTKLYNQLRYKLGSELQNQVYSQLDDPLYQWIGQLHDQIKDELLNRLIGELDSSDWDSILNRQFYNNNCIASELSACHGSWVEFCIEVLNLEIDRPLYSAFKSLVENCGWIYPFEKKCFVCDRPIQLHFDREYLLHAEGQPAVEFADKFSVYSYRGVRLPEIIGQVPPHSWQASWLLTEQNAEVRRVLIQAIGYRRICQELPATELDKWVATGGYPYQEYTLLKIENNIDIEPIYLLKMTCPSTGQVHVLRVPPKVRSSSRASLTAKEAISWVNWGIDPEKFQVQT